MSKPEPTMEEVFAILADAVYRTFHYFPGQLTVWGLCDGKRKKILSVPLYELHQALLRQQQANQTHDKK